MERILIKMRAPQTFKFNCSACGQRISGVASGARVSGICPGCGNDIDVVVPDKAAVSANPVSATPNAKNAIPLSIGAAILGMGPFLSLAAVRSLGREISMPQFQIGFGIVGLFCIAGLASGHVAFIRSKGRLLWRSISVLGLILGYLSLVFMALLFVGLSTGQILSYRPHMPPPPDFTIRP